MRTLDIHTKGKDTEHIPVDKIESIRTGHNGVNNYCTLITTGGREITAVVYSRGFPEDTYIPEADLYELLEYTIPSEYLQLTNTRSIRKDCIVQVKATHINEHEPDVHIWAVNIDIAHMEDTIIMYYVEGKTDLSKIDLLNEHSLLIPSAVSYLWKVINGEA